MIPAKQLLKMRKIISSIIMLILFTTNLFGQNDRDSLFTKIGFSTTIESQYLDDKVKLFIHHPFCFKPEKEYPIIVLLDANTSFKAFSTATELMAYDRSIPCCIVIGFPQYKYADFDKENLENRMENLSGFFREELIPYLSSKYHVSEKLIWGQGAESGLISSYMMLKDSNLFDGYISDVPNFSLIENMISSKKAFDNLQNKNVEYYLFGSTAVNYYNEAFLNNLKDNAPKDLHWNYRISNETNAIIYFLNNYMHAIELFFTE